MGEKGWASPARTLGWGGTPGTLGEWKNGRGFTSFRPRDGTDIGFYGLLNSYSTDFREGWKNPVEDPGKTLGGTQYSSLSKLTWGRTSCGIRGKCAVCLGLGPWPCERGYRKNRPSHPPYDSGGKRSKSCVGHMAQVTKQSKQGEFPWGRLRQAGPCRRRGAGQGLNPLKGHKKKKKKKKQNNKQRKGDDVLGLVPETPKVREGRIQSTSV